MRIRRLICLVSVTIFFAAPVAFAQTADNTDLCQGDALSKFFCATDLAQMLNQAFQFSIVLGGILAMLRIAYSGWLYMGREDMWSNKTKAKETFRDAIIGLLVLLAIWLILNQINPDILKLEFLQSQN